jgi:hypothetical protein
MSSLVGLKISNSYNLEDLKGLAFTESTIQWDAHELIKKTTIVSVVDFVISKLERCDEDAWEEFVYTNVRQILSNARMHSNNSTNPYANAVANSKREALMEIVDSLLRYLEPDTL